MPAGPSCGRENLETYALAGSADDATKHAAQALAIFEEKVDVTRAARARERLAKLGIAVEG
jgi:hypothetical protein